jgi:hypothetical protein
LEDKQQSKLKQSLKNEEKQCNWKRTKRNATKKIKTTQRKWSLSGRRIAKVILHCQPSSIRDKDKVTPSTRQTLSQPAGK